jgi:hypothetical protein
MHGLAKKKMEAGVPSPQSSPVWALWRTSRHRRKDDTSQKRLSVLSVQLLEYTEDSSL